MKILIKKISNIDELKRLIKNFFFFFLIFFLIRLILIFQFPASHELKYLIVAENILSGCGISFSLPGSQECIPAYGPNGPGYPFYLAIIKFFFNNENFIKVSQICIYFVSIFFLKNKVFEYTGSRKVSNITFAVLSISPLTLAWSRFILPETLMISLSIFFIGYVIKSLKKKNFFTLEFSLILIFMTFIRADAIFFVVPTVYLIFILHRFEIGVKKLIIFFLIFSIPWSFWTYRNLSIGASIFPNIYESYETKTKEKFPSGYNKWILSWAYDQYDFARALNPTHLVSDSKKNFNYTNIEIKDDIYFNKEEEYKTKKLLNELKLQSGKPFTESIDNKFKDLAIKRMNENKIYYYFILPLKRSLNLWINPIYSHGWPIQLQTKLKDNNIDINTMNIYEKIKLIKIFPVEICIKTVLFLWMILLIILFFLISFKKKEENVKICYSICLQLVIIKTIFFAYFGFFETRYIVNLIPFFEVLIIITFNNILIKSN